MVPITYASLVVLDSTVNQIMIVLADNVVMITLVKKKIVVEIK